LVEAAGTEARLNPATPVEAAAGITTSK
jgi:hypothetical protein